MPSLFPTDCGKEQTQVLTGQPCNWLQCRAMPLRWEQPGGVTDPQIPRSQVRLSETSFEVPSQALCHVRFLPELTVRGC